LRVLTRDPQKAQGLLGNQVEIVEGDSTNRELLRNAVIGCDSVHISLPTEHELAAVQQLINSGASSSLKLISYVSGTSVQENCRGFKVIERKLRAEALLRDSGIPYIIFRPTWVMEVLHRFVQSNKAVVISGRNPPSIHFFAASDFGRIVAAAYRDGRAIGKHFFIHGPHGISLTDALNAVLMRCYRNVRVTHLKLWQARLIARITGRIDYVSRLIKYFDEVGELGDPTEANALLGAPSTRFDDWVENQQNLI
jgi:uncharacterized protein YbjT (DUF2867 family)